MAATPSASSAASRMGRQLDEPRAVSILVQDLRGCLQREAGLADAPNADERDQAMNLKRLAHGGHLRLAADETSRLGRQISGNRVERL